MRDSAPRQNAEVGQFRMGASEGLAWGALLRCENRRAMAHCLGHRWGSKVLSRAEIATKGSADLGG